MFTVPLISLGARGSGQDAHHLLPLLPLHNISYVNEVDSVEILSHASLFVDRETFV